MLKWFTYSYLLLLCLLCCIKAPKNMINININAMFSFSIQTKITFKIQIFMFKMLITFYYAVLENNLIPVSLSGRATRIAKGLICPEVRTRFLCVYTYYNINNYFNVRTIKTTIGTGHYKLKFSILHNHIAENTHIDAINS